MLEKLAETRTLKTSEKGFMALLPGPDGLIECSIRDQRDRGDVHLTEGRPGMKLKAIGVFVGKMDNLLTLTTTVEVLSFTLCANLGPSTHPCTQPSSNLCI